MATLRTTGLLEAFPASSVFRFFLFFISFFNHFVFCFIIFEMEFVAQAVLNHDEPRSPASVFQVIVLQACNYHIQLYFKKKFMG